MQPSHYAHVLLSHRSVEQLLKFQLLPNTHLGSQGPFSLRGLNPSGFHFVCADLSGKIPGIAICSWAGEIKS